jgi:DNA-binding transcriptional regulator LsrR (DeoR family)
MSASSSFAELLGKPLLSELTKARALGDFAYAFFDQSGREVAVPAMATPHRLLGFQLLQRLSQRTDTRIVLVAGGQDKLDVIEKTLLAGLANTLITDINTGGSLLERRAESAPRGANLLNTGQYT